ncbi:MAG: Eco57I restriction-modification methylase domain-containing protein [Nitrospirota bacterium]|nr:Eco57I restriction-modification methylase domain-containing protein [Nitrospirota bacterium]
MKVQEIKQAIESTLKKFENQPLATAATSLFESLGYISQKRLKLTPNTSEQFLANFAQGKTFNYKLSIPEEWRSIDFLFQLTDDEIRAAGSQKVLFDSKGSFDGAVIESYLFIAIELKSSHYTRTVLANITREVNKLFAMPALILFRHGDTLTLAVINRRLHKRDQTRDVLEKVTLIKDVAFADPIRAHLEILNDFALTNLDTDFGVSNFVALHTAWQKRLGSYALSNDFYREIADWYFWAHHQVDDGTIRLPQHCDTEEERSLFLIRLLTRLIFCWFLVEKRLLPAELFRDYTLKKLLKDLSPAASTYYHAVLQNLFFGTLNMPSDQRAFREKKKDGQRYDKNFGITNLWRYEVEFRDSADWTALSARVPFLNGGLFDCLDDKTGQKKDNFILDGFSDNPKLACHLPNDLFFGPERTVDLSKDYGDEDSRTARSKKAKVRGLIEILSRYKFTIEENTPLEEEIALDPELLGKVFENLLASFNEDTRTTARKALGAFYTPREIVAYMVDEALKSYLGSQVPRCKGALEDLFSNKATLRDIRPDTRDALIAAIGRVKILDPACGSGAFPMGALHRLVDLLQKLDPNNESWKRDRLAEARRYRALLEESGAPKEEIGACDARIADIEKSFDTRFHALDFARKLYLIENAIYGVDIQPVAVQIAKLRFFISLVVDQKVDHQVKNLGVRPLPNLETRLVAADTLIPIEKAESDLYSGEIDQLRADLTRIRHEHFNARDPGNKRKWREADATKRQEIAQLLEREHAIPKQAARQLAAWDPYDQNAFAPFFDSEWMFGFPVGKVKINGKAPATLLGNLTLVNEAAGQTELTASESQEVESGFDIVIGNPPYVRIQTLKKKDPKVVTFFKDHYASAAKGNYDLYVVFIEAGLRLLKSDGHLAYICPHKFFNSQYGEPLRELISRRKRLRHVVHFGDEQVFPGATIYTCLLFLANGGSPDCRFVKAHDFQAWKATLSGVDGRFQPESITGSEWNFTVGKDAAVFSKLDQCPTRLGDVASIFVGLQTSADRLFVLRERAVPSSGLAKVESRDGVQWEVETTFLKPFLADVSLAPYRAPASNHWLIFPYILSEHEAKLVSAKELKSACPKLWEYLKSNEADLRARESGKADSLEWYGYIYRKNLTLFDSPKLIVQVISQSPRFSFDASRLYFTGGGNGPYYGVRWNSEARNRPIHFLQALLNSRICDYFISNISTPFRGGYWSYGKRFIERIPVPLSVRELEQVVSSVVQWLISLHRYYADHAENLSTRDPLMLAYWERVLNGLVYELYFPEEVHGAGLRLFKLVEQAGLPDLESILEPDQLARLRQIFETLYDGDHPLRMALDKLQTLDIIRIIEGKA